MLKIQRNLAFSPQIQQRRQRINITDSSEYHSQECHQNKRHRPVVIREGEHGYSDIAKNKVFGQKAQQFKGELGMILGFLGEIIICVVSLRYSTE